MHDHPNGADSLSKLATEVKRLKEIIETNSDWIWEVDSDFRYIFSSATGKIHLGYDQKDIIGKTPFDFMPPDEALRVKKQLSGAIATRRSFSRILNRNLRRDGSLVVLETSGIPVFDEMGSFQGYRGIDRDVTATSERFHKLERLYALAPLPLFVVDRKHRFRDVNEAFAALCGVPVSEILDRKVADFVPYTDETLQADFIAADANGEVAEREYEWHGREFIGSYRPLRDIGGSIIGLSTAWMDITERSVAAASLAEANERLERYAHEDYLTGLWNRRSLDDRLVTEVRSSQRAGRPVSVIMADVDFFKKYNDHYGHQAGDECLKAVAEVFKRNLQRASDTVGRYGGEEFCAVLGDTDRNGVELVAEKLRASVEKLGISHKGNPNGFVTISMGVAVMDFSSTSLVECDSVKELVAAADAALYAAKRAGRNTVR